MKCEWFLLCKNEAVRTRPHPILGAVPICERCDKNMFGDDDDDDLP